MRWLLLLALFITAQSLLADDSANLEIKVYRDPDCHCCHKWINHLKENKFNVVDLPTRNMSQVKDTVKLPRPMASCHTAIIDGYVIEGHVPASDIVRLLTDKPNIAGLSVPKMPVGTPGMEMGERKAPFVVFQFNKAGKFSAYNRYTLDENNQYQQHIADEQH
jgi:hypothetical protein